MSRFLNAIISAIIAPKANNDHIAIPQPVNGIILPLPKKLIIASPTPRAKIEISKKLWYLILLIPAIIQIKSSGKNGSVKVKNKISSVRVLSMF